jgi:hypothetical protein
MKLIKIIAVVAISAALLHWIRQDYPFGWRELLPFANLHSLGLYDLAATIMLVISAFALQRLREPRG